MSYSGLPLPERILIRLLIRGPGAEFVAGDLMERYRDDLKAETGARARARLRRQILASALRMRAPASPGLGQPLGGPVTRSSRSAGASLVQDCRIAMRGLRRRPGFALGVAGTLALGVGATTTIFSVVDGVMLKPLPFAEPGALVSVGTMFPGREWEDQDAGLQHLAGISVRNWADLRARARSFEGLVAIEATNVLIPDRGNGPELARAAFVSEDLFPVFRLTPAVGRTFLPQEFGAGAAPVVMLSFGAWQRRYAADPGVVGQPLDGPDNSPTIVGVLPRGFAPPEAFFSTVPEFWMPLQPDSPRYESRGMRSLYLVGRLSAGTTQDQARDEARQIAEQLAVEFPEGNVYPNGDHLGIGVNGLHAQTVGTTGRALAIFLGASVLLLLLAALNAATLLLARALDRMRELGVRMALGAGRARVARLLLVESVLLAVVGGALGVLLAFGGVEAFVRLAPPSIPRVQDVAVDARVLLVASLVSLGTGLAAGLVPALRLTRRAPWERLRGSGSSATQPVSRLRASLVGGQVALAMVLLSGAGLLFSSFLRIRSVEPGFRPEGLISMSVGLKRPGAEDEPTWQGWDRLLAEVRSVPGLNQAEGTTNPPFQDPFWAPRLLLPGDTPDVWREGIAGYAITPGYLQIMGTRLLRGRAFDVGDGPSTEPVAIVNESFVRTQLGGDEAIGVIVRHSEAEEEKAIRIVGIVEDVVQTRAEDGPRAAIYFPYTQWEWPLVQAVARTELPLETALPALRKAAGRFNPIAPARDVRSMEDRMVATRTTPRFQALLLGAFASVAILLAAAGLYGSLAHAVGQRKQELGVRMALGAGESTVWWMVLRQGLALAALGLVVGLAATLAGTRALRGFLYEVAPHDPATLLTVGALLMLIAALACVVPARRATGVDPVRVLKAE